VAIICKYKKVSLNGTIFKKNILRECNLSCHAVEFHQISKQLHAVLLPNRIQNSMKRQQKFKNAKK